MTAPTGWWCPHCGHTVNAVVGTQPDNTPDTPCTSGAGQRPHAFVPGVSEDGDVSNEWCNTCGEAQRPVVVPVGDDTPAPTAQWTVDWVSTPQSMLRGLFRDGERVPLSQVVRILNNRAGAAPDLTARVPGTDWLLDILRRRIAAEPGLHAAVAALVRNTPEPDDG